MKCSSASLALPVCSAALALICASAASALPSRSSHAALRHGTLGAITEYAIPTASAGPLGIVAGPDGALWFAEQTASQIGRVTTTGSFSEYATPTNNASPGAVTATVDPNYPIWFTESAAGNLGLVNVGGFITAAPVATSCMATSPLPLPVASWHGVQ